MARSRAPARVRATADAVPRRTPPATAGSRRRLTALGRAQQSAPVDELERERLVAHVVEEHHDLVAVVALEHALAEGRVRHAGADREGLVRGRRLDQTRVAVVAVPAGRLEGLPEVREHEAAPAAARLGIRAHHVDARTVERAPVLLRLERSGDRLLAWRR